MLNAIIKSNIIVEARGILDTKLTERLAKFSRSTLRNMCDITYAASLAHHGLLGSYKFHMLELRDDLTPVQAGHLASLVPAVMGHVNIQNVRGCDLVTILDSVKCKWLNIESQSLGVWQTQALVRAIESRVVMVRLEDVKIHSALTSCNLMTLAKSRNWNIVEDYCPWNEEMDGLKWILKKDPIYITRNKGSSIVTVQKDVDDDSWRFCY